jgi:hypothetical protein
MPEDHLETMERLIAEAEACHAEEVQLVQALTGGHLRATEAERRLRETETMLEHLHRIWSRFPAAPKQR